VLAELGVHVASGLTAAVTVKDADAPAGTSTMASPPPMPLAALAMVATRSP
jgi:hypothetical protein